MILFIHFSSSYMCSFNPGLILNQEMLYKALMNFAYIHFISKFINKYRALAICVNKLKRNLVVLVSYEHL